jgi:hypothetical protein
MGDLSKICDLLVWKIYYLISLAYFCKAREVEIFSLGKMVLLSMLLTLIYFNTPFIPYNCPL